MDDVDRPPNTPEAVVSGAGVRSPAAAGSQFADGSERTGHPAVDAVLASLEGLEEIPVSERVALFERAHEGLRRTLNDAGEV